MLRNYIKIALRNIRKNKALSFINIAGLSIGLACCILILLYIKDELSFDGFHLKKGNICQLTCVRTEQDGDSQKFAIAALVQGPAFKQQIPEIQDFTRVNPKDIVIKKATTFLANRLPGLIKTFLTYSASRCFLAIRIAYWPTITAWC